jgi:hypothetical protein
MHTKFWLEDLKVRDDLGILCVDGRIMLRWISRMQNMMMWTGFVWLRQGPVVGSCEHSHETLGSRKGGEFD